MSLVPPAQRSKRLVVITLGPLPDTQGRILRAELRVAFSSFTALTSFP